MNCWKGCLATVIRGPGVGALVQCVERVQAWPEYSPSEVVWKVELLSICRGTSLTTGKLTTEHPGTIALSRDSSLKPLPPDQQLDSDSIPRDQIGYLECI